MNTYSKTLYKVKENGSDEVSQGHHLSRVRGVDMFLKLCTEMSGIWHRGQSY